MDNQSIQHTRWNCTYHIVFIPKYRKKVMYGSNKKDIVEIIKKLCEMKGIRLIEGKVCVDHIHMYVAIPLKMSVSETMSYLKGKSALMFYDRHPEIRTKWGDCHLWARGYYVATQSFIPFILYGDRTSSRLDSFGSSDRRMEYYFLGGGEEVKNRLYGKMQ